MLTLASRLARATGLAKSASRPRQAPLRVVLTFDLEEHHRIESAAALLSHPAWRARYGQRMEDATRWLLDQLAEHSVLATFFVVAELGRDHPGLMRALADAGHEVASHGWDHRRLHHLTPLAFREDLQKSRDVLEQLTGRAVVGYRAPTFSVVRETSWAIDILAEEGWKYDSSIFPVRHDRYGVPDAPRGPFVVHGSHGRVLELPPATLGLGALRVPTGGGGYFRLLPTWLLERSLGQAAENEPPVATLYFHPWEFDPDQPRLPLRRVSRWRTYAGIFRTRPRLSRLLASRPFVRAIDVAQSLQGDLDRLPNFYLAG